MSVKSNGICLAAAERKDRISGLHFLQGTVFFYMYQSLVMSQLSTILNLRSILHVGVNHLPWVFLSWIWRGEISSR